MVTRRANIVYWGLMIARHPLLALIAATAMARIGPAAESPTFTQTPGVATSALQAEARKRDPIESEDADSVSTGSGGKRISAYVHRINAQSPPSSMIRTLPESSAFDSAASNSSLVTTLLPRAMFSSRDRSAIS